MPQPPPDALITEPTAIFAFLASVLGLIYWLSSRPALEKLFSYLPPVIWAYFLPMFATAAGITPPANPAYSWMITYLLPFALLLLTVTVDAPAILRLGKIALVMMLAGTTGIVLGGPISYFIFGTFLPADAWTGFAALSGSWIGGTLNMMAIAQSVGTPDAALAPIIVVDTVVGYGWMAVLLFMSAYQARFDRRIGASTAVIEDVRRRLEDVAGVRRPVATADLAVIVGIAFGVSVLGVMAGARLPDLGDPVIISGTTWTVLMMVTIGLIFSFTPARKIEEAGASRIGYFALYLLLTAVGARADLHAILAAPVYLLAGVVWMLVHVGIMFAVALLLRAPLFFVATGSMANVGGIVSAPIVAGIYLPGLAPVGLLMAVAGYIVGIYGGLACAWLLSQVAAIL